MQPAPRTVQRQALPLRSNPRRVERRARGPVRFHAVKQIANHRRQYAGTQVSGRMSASLRRAPGCQIERLLVAWFGEQSDGCETHDAPAALGMVDRLFGGAPRPLLAGTQACPAWSLVLPQDFVFRQGVLWKLRLSPADLRAIPVQRRSADSLHHIGLIDWSARPDACEQTLQREQRHLRIVADFRFAVPVQHGLPDPLRPEALTNLRELRELDAIAECIAHRTAEQASSLTGVSMVTMASASKPLEQCQEAISTPLSSPHSSKLFVAGIAPIWAGQSSLLNPGASTDRSPNYHEPRPADERRLMLQSRVDRLYMNGVPVLVNR